MKKLTALFIGRFQPLHKGHVNAIRELFKKYDKIVIAIGSTNKQDSKNPFSFQERKSMLNSVLRKYKRPYRIIGVPDVKSDEEWKEELIRNSKKSDVVVTGNPWTERCFNDFRVIKPSMLNPKKYNATRIRKSIEENGNWQSLVPKEIVRIIKKHRLIMSSDNPCLT